MMNFFKMLFLGILMTSTLITISALSWFTAWMGLEMNLLAIIPLMKTSQNKLSAEAAIKYFIVQAMASAILLFSITLISLTNNTSFELSSVTSSLIDSTLILKMGAAPLHFWLPEVVSGLDWNLVFIILTWQKIAPMILLSYCMNPHFLLSCSIILSSFISGILGINQTCMRKLMAFSSINHMGWMLSTLFSSLNLWFYYFSIYALTNFNILVLFHKIHLFYMNQLSKITLNNKLLKFFFMFNFLSLGGLPPFLGFLPKWLTINFLVNSNFLTLSIILVLFTLVTLFFYVRLTFSSFTLNSEESMTSSLTSNFKSWQALTNLYVLMGLPLFFFMANIY
uniref:NADH-ubiquinone oxidoreductase chain 2 n=1 Tax=Trigonopterus singkawangensis TaxID=1729343 RepID=A0A7H1KHZ2_9CUCU|nr:NADH dehydrogenase subunit 2 [Trigonopterus singkawangensis]QNT26908.1 NADH dehydrogenase subunit 2 [Trigonopterus singkawangensis]